MLFAFILVSWFLFYYHNKKGARVSNPIFVVGTSVSLIVSLWVALNEFIIADIDGIDADISGKVLVVIFEETNDGADDGMNDDTFESSLTDMLLNTPPRGSLA